MCICIYVHEYSHGSGGGHHRQEDFMKSNAMNASSPNTNSSVSESEKRTSMNIALTTEDKQFLKVYAAKHNTNVAAMIAKYVDTLRVSEDKD